MRLACAYKVAAGCITHAASGWRLPAPADINKPIVSVEAFDGGRTRARTWDPLIKSQLLYQLSYAPIESNAPVTVR